MDKRENYNHGSGKGSRVPQGTPERGQGLDRGLSEGSREIAPGDDGSTGAGMMLCDECANYESDEDDEEYYCRVNMDEEEFAAASPENRYTPDDARMIEDYHNLEDM